MLSGQHRLMKTQGQSLLDPWAIFVSLHLKFGCLVTKLGRERAEQSLIALHAPSRVNRKDLVTRSLLCPLSNSSIALFHYRPPPPKHHSLHQVGHHAIQQLCRENLFDWPCISKYKKDSQYIHVQPRTLDKSLFLKNSHPDLGQIYNRFKGIFST